jgi:SNF2 family DNA or RNA helicase
MKYEPKGPPRYRHQRRGLNKMLATGGRTALLFDPGTGKTAVVLDYAGLLALKSPRGEARVLVVAPLAAVDTWVMQAETYVTDQVHVWAEVLGGSIVQRAQGLASRGGLPMRGTPARGRSGKWQGPRAAHWQLAWSRYMRGSQTRVGPIHASEGPDGLGTDKPRLVLEVVNLDTMASRHRDGSRTRADLVLEAVKRFDPDLVVVDESHKIKGVQANASRLMARIGEVVPRRVILTGTVMPHSPLDVFAQWRFLDPYAFGEVQVDGTTKRATFGAFKERYVQMGGWMGQQAIGFHHLDEMERIMAINAVVARKDDVLDLPPTTTITLPVHLTDAEKRAYKQMADSLVINLPLMTATANNRLAQMMRLRQITSGYAPDDNGTVHDIGRSKVDTISSLVHDTLAGETRVVVFALFIHEIDRLCAALARKGTEVLRITGSTSNEDRMAMRARFGSDDPARLVMVAQIKTMSLAVNELVTASHAIFASLSQQRDDLIQAQDRLNRIGQKRPVTFWYAIAPRTVDAVIMKAHAERTDLEAAMLAHVEEVHAHGLNAQDT